MFNIMITEAVCFNFIPVLSDSILLIDQDKVLLPDITLIDIAPLLTQTLAEKFKHSEKGRIKIITGDFFEHEGKYDLILEQTFLSALNPSLRPEYAAKMHQLLTPGGRLAGVLFNKHFDESPPYGGGEEEYRELFVPLFDIKVLAPCYNSIQRRAGSELFINLAAKEI